MSFKTHKPLSLADLPYDASNFAEQSLGTDSKSHPLPKVNMAARQIVKLKLNDLPYDLLEKIFSHFDRAVDVITISKMKEFQEVVDTSPDIWNNVLITNFDDYTKILKEYPARKLKITRRINSTIYNFLLPVQDYLYKLTKIEVTSFYDTITDNDLWLIASAKRLKHLILDDPFSESDIGDYGMKQIGTLTELQTLSLNLNYVSFQGYMHLKKLPKLEKLEIRSRAFTDVHLKHLCKIPKLHTFYLYNFRGLTDKSLEFINQMPKLKRLKLEGILQITEDGLKNFGKKLIELSLGSCKNITSFQALENIGSLQEISLVGNPKIRSLNWIFKLTGLKEINLKRFTFDGLTSFVIELSKLPNLEFLELCACSTVDQKIVMDIMGKTDLIIYTD